MEEKLYKEAEILGKVCLLKADFLRFIYGNDEEIIKESRPYLVIKLMYEQSQQLFAVPLQTNIKKSFNEQFWEKLPARLETEPGYSRGMIYSLMIPISLSAVDSIKSPEGEIPNRLDLQLKIFNSLTKKRESDVPEQARDSFRYLKKVIIQNGLTGLKTEAANKAYAKIAKVTFSQTTKLINENLSKKENGLRPIISKAQAYLDCYLAQVEDSHQHVNFPKHYTKIKQYIERLNSSKYKDTIDASNGASQKLESEQKLLAKKYGFSENVIATVLQKQNGKVCPKYKSTEKEDGNSK